MAKSILVVDDDPMIRRLLEKHLTTAGYEVVSACDGREALEILLAGGPKLLVTDWIMPEMDGLELCQAVLEAEGIGFVYTIMLTAQSDREQIVEAFDVGIDDYLTKPFDKQELVARVNAGYRLVKLEEGLARQQRLIVKANAEMAILNGKLERMATVDDLTGLFNRREGMARLQEYWATAYRHGQPLACIMIDIDDFKGFNDTHGHDVGDIVLQSTARTLHGHARMGDSVCRWGGEEFLLICPGTTLAEAEETAERLRQAVEAHRIVCQDQSLKLTVSVGVAALDETVGSIDVLLRKADQALYQAKGAGRNRVVVSGESPPRVDTFSV